MRIFLYNEIEGKQLKCLFDFCFDRCDNIYLTNYYTDLITKEEEDKAYKELKRKHILGDMKRREAFYNDESFRKRVMETYKTEENSILYFNTLILQDLPILGEEPFLYMINRKIEERNINKEIRNNCILEDIKRRKKFCNDESFHNDMLKKYKTQENVIMFFNTLIEEELGIVLVDNLMTTENLGVMMDEEEHNESYGKRYASYDAIKQRLNIFKQDFILTERNITNSAKMTEGGAFVEYRFEINNSMKMVLRKMEKIYDIPELVSEIMLEDPVFCCGDKEFLSICSHEHYAVLRLSEEEYKEFLKFNILHDIEE